ncbi:ribosome recycling factor [Persicirhabdus sediminis]|uniref:Ribosome-recycling factor n=1 Tax=Persicirhabdus sediminis TaxID=454144 RepID=A0A8J7MD78_9BACT|nr:ribosome recycling factor [Persicirhabdus sediminis]MBK1790417.1 ribosome recycling factor [Persicirhabdus sediminis]
MEPTTVIKEVEDAMNKAVEYMGTEFSGVRTGKASPALIENLDVHVASYGTKSKLKALAVITVPEPRMLMVQPFDPSTVKDIEKAIIESNVGINPSNEGRSLRLPVPELSEERRRDMVKMVKGLAEDARVRVRACRKDGMDKAKKMKNENALTEDGQRDFENQVQELTNAAIKEIDRIFALKEEEVMTV